MRTYNTETRHGFYTIVTLRVRRLEHSLAFSPISMVTRKAGIPLRGSKPRAGKSVVVPSFPTLCQGVLFYRTHLEPLPANNNNSTNVRCCSTQPGHIYEKWKTARQTAGRQNARFSAG